MHHQDNGKQTIVDAAIDGDFGAKSVVRLQSLRGRHRESVDTTEAATTRIRRLLTQSASCASSGHSAKSVAKPWAGQDSLWSASRIVVPASAHHSSTSDVSVSVTKTSI